ncbi:hypothetical protein TREMEDRAFT_63232 [Tremella mesenterica DSM 1558]|uniref:uncharacterized protein n=1 Tax=Tremella mesenterica (strain ATCC 24925 / CBS 8224 / DSM 1558 / NBRC 9311 / NRRL Y-6157 / RJB 2259-6 / UBC 559-6) TaxID=578456 RepID=UPI0003F49C47|nr:uncharacterized protein TREMEDRAFT_63232 [Tremella mesenterica DSM 1558]EIW68773.1 hypothetical protein TREMEDRAFT_63232 [Tremella mesenterica DSM 1558]
MSLDARICVITGAAGRIGRAIVERFQQEGATVVAVDILSVSLPGVDNVICDQGDPSSIQALEQHLKQKYGRIDCLINNGALGGYTCPIHEKPLEEYDDVMRVNVRGPFLLIQAALRLHLSNPSKELSIINMASIAGHRPGAGNSVYSVSKHGLIGLTKAAASEYGGQGVRCNSISPGMMEVPNVQGILPERFEKGAETIPLRRRGKPVEIAELAVFLASDKASYINGADYLVDGGRMVV